MSAVGTCRCDEATFAKTAEESGLALQRQHLGVERHETNLQSHFPKDGVFWGVALVFDDLGHL
jgi:hypothetical protein